MNNIKVSREIKGKDVAEALLRILTSGKPAMKLEAREDGVVTRIILKGGPEELDFTGNSYGQGQLIVRCTVNEDELVHRVVFTGDAVLKKIKALDLKEVVDFKHPHTAEDAKTYAERICENLGISSFAQFRLEKLTVKPTADGGQVTGTTVVATEDDMPF